MKLLVLSIVLASAWFVSADPVNLLKPANKEESWRLEQIDGGKAKLSVDADSVSIQVTETDGTDWHVQIVQPDLDLKDGTTYTLKFKARSPEEALIQVNAMIDQDDWHEIGLREEIYLRKDYREYSYEFRARDTVSKKNRVSFVLGSSKSLIQIKDVSLVAN